MISAHKIEIVVFLIGALLMIVGAYMMFEQGGALAAVGLALMNAPDFDDAAV